VLQALPFHAPPLARHEPLHGQGRQIPKRRMRQQSLREEALFRRDALFDYRSGQAAPLQEMPSIPIDERRIREGVGFLQQLSAHREKALKRPPRPLKLRLRLPHGKCLRHRASRNPGAHATGTEPISSRACFSRRTWPWAVCRAYPAATSQAAKSPSRAPCAEAAYRA
jgi:hypothetical protein